ncbi:MAG TPA: DUF748 domain-containing protein [Polyangia bacterium]|nr:DUF748 domain-containing protein [Polyangia bacterium]
MAIRHRRGLLWAAIVVFALVVIIRVVLDPIATVATRKGLEKMKGMQGDFQRVHVTVFGPGYTINRLKLIQHPGGDWKAPLFYAEAVHVAVDWRQLLHGHLAASARLVEPKIIVLAGAPSEPKPKAEAKPPDLSAQLSQITPLRIARVEIVRGELLLRDMAEARHPELWVHKLELAAENLPTRKPLAGGRPTTVTARAQVGKSGEMTLFASADPFASPLAMAGRFELHDLRVAEIYDFVEPRTKLQTPNGTFDLFAEFKVKNGRIDGGVKPLLKNVDVRPADSGLWHRLEGWLADEAVKLASDRVPDRHAVATTIPIQGRLTDPDIQMWPAILGVLRNAFVAGLASGFAHLPPVKADDKESALTQAKDAVTKSNGPPKAQPVQARAGRAL